MPACFAGRTYAEIWSTPADVARPGEVMDRFIWLWDAALGPTVFSFYGDVEPRSYDAIVQQRERGLTNYGAFDHTQSSTPTQKPLVAGLFVRRPELYTSRDIVIGTAQKAHAILHKKEVVFNAPVDGYDVPDQDFATLEDAVAAGYPIVWTGSWNINIRAEQQQNTIVVLPGKVAARALTACMAAERAYILTHQMAYQPIDAPIRPETGYQGNSSSGVGGGA